MKSQPVVVNVSEFPPPGTVTPDTVYYSLDRKLTWDDFKGKVRRGSPSVANTFTGFSYDATALLRQDTIFVHVYLHIYFDRQGSWVRQNEKSAYALSHEQLHFDIAKLVADQFRDTLLRTHFTAENYGSLLNFLYWDYWRKMTDMEQQFDAETNHGINRVMEAIWEKKIRKALLSGSGQGLLPDE